MVTPLEKDFLGAALRDDLQTVKDLVEVQNVTITVSNFNQQTAAHLAVEKGNLAVFKYLVNKDPALLTTVDTWDNTVLHQAVKKGALEMVKYLVDDLKIDIYRPEHRLYGDTAVHIAAEEGQLAVLKYFIEEKHADVNLKDELGAPPLFLAAEKVQMHIVQYLIEDMNANVTMLDMQQDNILHRSALIGDLTVPKYLLNERKIHFDVNWQDKYGRTILHSAARHGKLEFMKYFISAKEADFEIANKLGWTAMHEAASEGYLIVVRYLFEKGAKTDCKDFRGRTPIQVCNNQNVIKYLKTVAQTRRRRSLIDSFAFKPTRLTDGKHKMLGELTPKVTCEREYGNALDMNRFQIQSFLTIAEVFLRVVNRVSSVEAKPLYLSTRDILQNKMDPIAVKAVWGKSSFR